MTDKPQDDTPQDNGAALASIMISLLNNWGVEDRDKITLLGLPVETKPRSLQRYHHGTPLPDDEEVYTRVEHLLGIEQSLGLANPLNDRAGVLWLYRRNRRLHGRTPISLMIEEGLAGIVRVRREIDCSFDWYLDEQQAKSAMAKSKT